MRRNAYWYAVLAILEVRNLGWRNSLLEPFGSPHIDIIT